MNDKPQTTSERETAIKVANIILNDDRRDPDSTESMLSRQFLRALEAVEHWKKISAENDNAACEANGYGKN